MQHRERRRALRKKVVTAPVYKTSKFPTDKASQGSSFGLTRGCFPFLSLKAIPQKAFRKVSRRRNDPPSRAPPLRAFRHRTLIAIIRQESFRGSTPQAV